MTPGRAGFSLARRLAAEGVGTALLLAIVVGSGVMGSSLASGNEAVALLVNAVSTGAGLFVLITLLGPISGAQFNPLVTLIGSVSGQVARGEALARTAIQVAGAVAGVLLAHAMFDLPLVQVSEKVRAGAGQVFSEALATFGLLMVVQLGGRLAPGALPGLVALYITAAYGFTASTAFANPAVTLARTLTDTFAGIAPASAPGFVVGQAAGALGAIFASRWLFGRNQPQG